MVPVRRRRSLALSLATGGLPTAHGAGSTLRGMWLGVASTEDQDCVLQGQQSTCELRDDVVRLSGLHVSPTVINERDGGAVSKLQPRRESGRDEVHENADQTVESAQPRTSQHRGHRAGLQPRLAGLDELLRAIPSLGALSSPEILQPCSEGLGHEQAQAIPGQEDTGWSVPTTDGRVPSESVCALALRYDRCVCLMGAV